MKEYSKVRVILSFIVLAIVFFIVSSIVNLLLLMFLYFLSESIMPKFLFSMLPGIDSFIPYGVAAAAGIYSISLLIDKLLPGSYLQQQKCMKAFGILLLITGLLNFIPSFFRGFDASSRMPGLIQILISVGIIKSNLCDQGK